MHATVLKLGGELLEDRPAMTAAAHGVMRLVATGPVVVVHGGGRSIDAELRARGETPRFVDGLRVTDAAALDAVVSVLAGKNNTAFVASINACGGRAVGLTGADAMIGLSSRTAAFESVKGEKVDLGLVGQPQPSDLALLHDLLRGGYIPVVASIGMTPDGDLLNVNADTLAGHLAAGLAADRLIIAGGTAGVLDEGGQTIPLLSEEDIARMTACGAAHSGMIAKLAACTRALEAGVGRVSIVAGRSVSDYAAATGTVIAAARSMTR